jgi:hypothetical protein
MRKQIWQFLAVVPCCQLGCRVFAYIFVLGICLGACCLGTEDFRRSYKNVSPGDVLTLTVKGIDQACEMYGKWPGKGKSAVKWQFNRTDSDGIKPCC